jgi:hypothetical protein
MHGLNCMTDDDAGGESVCRACSSFCTLGGVDELWCHFSPQFLSELARFCPSICCCPSYIH